MRKLLYIILLSVLCLPLMGQITVNTFFEFLTPNPSDSRDSLTTLADTANVNPLVLYPGVEAWARDVGQKWLYNGTKWVFLYDSNGLSSNVAQDTSVRPTYLPGHNYTDGLLYAIKADFTRASAEFADSIHTTFIVGAPDVDSVYIQYAGRYTQVGHGYEVGRRYFLTDDTADQFDTIAGTFLDAVFVVIDANTLELLNQGVDINTTINRRVIPSPFITAYGGDPLNPTDSIIQAVVEGIYVPTGRATPGTIFLTQFAGASKNPAHQATSGLPSTPSNMWYWDGVLVTRNNFTQKAISLQDTTYGSLYTLPLDTVQLIAGVPTDSTVADWLEVNYTNNNLRLNNGTILYWRGTGTDQNPELSWQIVDFLTPPTTGDNWDAMIVRIGGEKWLATELVKGDVRIESSNSLYLQNGDGFSQSTYSGFYLESLLGEGGFDENGIAYDKDTIGYSLSPFEMQFGSTSTDALALTTDRYQVFNYSPSFSVGDSIYSFQFLNYITPLVSTGARIMITHTESAPNKGTGFEFLYNPNGTLSEELKALEINNGDVFLEQYNATKLDTATHVLGVKFSEGGKLVPVLNSGGGGSGENIGNTDLTTDDDRILTTGTNTFTLDGTGQISIGDWSGNNNAQYLDINDTGNTIDIQSGGIITIGDAIGDYNGTTITVRDDNGNIIMNTSSGDILQTTTGGDLKLRSTTGSLILGDESVNSLVIDESTGVVSLSASDKVVANPDNEFTIISSDVNVTATNFNISALTLNLDTIPTDTAQFLLARQDNGNVVRIDETSVGTWLKPELDNGNDVEINSENTTSFLSDASLGTRISSYGLEVGGLEYDGSPISYLDQDGLGVFLDLGGDLESFVQIQPVDSQIGVYDEDKSVRTLLSNNFTMISSDDADDDIGASIIAKINQQSKIKLFRGNNGVDPLDLTNSTPVQNNDTIGEVGFYGQKVSGNLLSTALPLTGRIYSVSTENFTATSTGSKIVIETTPNTTTNQVDGLTIDQNSDIYFNQYGSGTKTGTPATYPAFDATGRIIESATPYGGGSADGVVTFGTYSDITEDLSLTVAMPGTSPVVIDLTTIATDNEVDQLVTPLQDTAVVHNARLLALENDISVLQQDSSLMKTLPVTDVAINAPGNDLAVDLAQVEWRPTLFGRFGVSGLAEVTVSPGAGFINVFASDGMTFDVTNGSGSITFLDSVGVNDQRIYNLGPGIDTTDAINKNQLDSLITALETFTDSTTLTVDLAGKHNKIIEWDMTGVSNAGTITLAEPLNAFGSTTEAGVYTFVIFDCDTHDFDFPASFRNMGGTTAYDAGTTVEVVDFLSFTCYFNGTIYRCQ